jgi:hypothetical protein
MLRSFVTLFLVASLGLMVARGELMFIGCAIMAGVSGVVALGLSAREGWRGR